MSDRRDSEAMLLPVLMTDAGFVAPAVVRRAPDGSLSVEPFAAETASTVIPAQAAAVLRHDALSEGLTERVRYIIAEASPAEALRQLSALFAREGLYATDADSDCILLALLPEVRVI